MTEQEFADSIDCRFPYGDFEAASHLIDQGWEISPNAAFCVLHEICRPPKHIAATVATLDSLSSIWATRGEHPLKALVLECARALIAGKSLAWEDSLKVMEQIRSYHGQYAALSIVYFSGDCSTDEGDKALEHADADIRRHWNRM